MEPGSGLQRRGPGLGGGGGGGLGSAGVSPALSGPQARRRKQPPRPADFKLQVIIIGSRGVGKTSLMERFTDDTFCEACKSTVGTRGAGKRERERQRGDRWAAPDRVRGGCGEMGGIEGQPRAPFRAGQVLDLRSSNSFSFPFPGDAASQLCRGTSLKNNGWPEILPLFLPFASTRASDPIGNAHSDHNLQHVCRGNSTFRNQNVFKMGNFQLPGISPAAEFCELKVFKLARSRNTDLVHCFITGLGRQCFLIGGGRNQK